MMTYYDVIIIILFQRVIKRRRLVAQTCGLLQDESVLQPVREAAGKSSLEGWNDA